MNYYTIYEVYGRMILKIMCEVLRFKTKLLVEFISNLLILLQCFCPYRAQG